MEVEENDRAEKEEEEDALQDMIQAEVEYGRVRREPLLRNTLGTRWRLILRLR